MARICHAGPFLYDEVRKEMPHAADFGMRNR